jgi:hypothetical protein
VIISVIRSAHGLARYALSIMLSMWRSMSGKFDTFLIQFY